jgi:hypothetical protein
LYKNTLAATTDIPAIIVVRENCDSIANEVISPNPASIGNLPTFQGDTKGLLSSGWRYLSNIKDKFTNA